MKQLLMTLACIFALAGCNQTGEKIANGTNQTETIRLGPDAEKRIEYYSDKTPRTIANYKNGKLNGVSINYSPTGNPDSVQLYLNGNLSAVRIDPSDYAFKRIYLDSSFSIKVPKFWTTLKQPNTLYAIRKDSSEGPFLPNLIVFKGDVNGLPQKKEEIEKQFLQILNGSGSSTVIKDVRWLNDNLLFCLSLKQQGEIVIGRYSYIYIGERYYYVIDCSAYNGIKADFIKYFDLYQEIMLSIMYNNTTVNIAG